MAKRGPKPKTNQQKKAQGETRPCRLADNIVEFPVVDAVPDVPEWINADGQELWKEITPALFKQKVLTHADLHSLTHLCQLHGKIVDGYKRQVMPTAAEIAQLRLLFAEFGMTPSSRTRVKAGGDSGQENKFRRNGKKT